MKVKIYLILCFYFFLSCTENKFGIDKNIPDKTDFNKELNIELNKHYLE
ncbi:hypothetical protein SAMN05443292_0177 [Halpernia frigidisoli]|uniref:Lipoprotein n=1 Tax=Halpernia frigidisoli TaxID=1125876 RepID=A0A1I3CZR7_9FLAO|nr:hypothetical protein SAMN05443292_0177 [Halpernia frigidisoli]